MSAIRVGDTFDHPLGDYSGTVVQVGTDPVTGESATEAWLYDTHGADVVMIGVEGVGILVRPTQRPARGWEGSR